MVAFALAAPQAPPQPITGLFGPPPAILRRQDDGKAEKQDEVYSLLTDYLDKSMKLRDGSFPTCASDEEQTDGPPMSCNNLKVGNDEERRCLAFEEAAEEDAMANVVQAIECQRAYWTSNTSSARKSLVDCAKALCSKSEVEKVEKDFPEYQKEMQALSLEYLEKAEKDFGLKLSPNSTAGPSDETDSPVPTETDTEADPDDDEDEDGDDDSDGPGSSAGSIGVKKLAVLLVSALPIFAAFL